MRILQNSKIILWVIGLVLILASCNLIPSKKHEGNFDLTMILKAEGTAGTKDMDSIVHILKKRFIAYGVKEESITLKYSGDEISLKIEKVDNPERLALLSSTTGSLEFWETYDMADVYPQLLEANTKLAEILKSDTMKNVFTESSVETKTTENTDPADTTSLVGKMKNNKNTNDQSFAEYTKENPLFARLNPNLQQGADGKYFLGKGPNVGYGLISDTSKINKMLSIAIDQNIFKRDIKFLWEIKPFDDAQSILWLIAIKISDIQGNAALDGSFVTSARQDFDPSGNVVISMEMNSEGANIWKRLTADNVGKNIAIVFDDYVYSYPLVSAEIPNGRSLISGNFTVEEAEDLATILTLGKLPCKLKVISTDIVEKK